MCEKLSIRLEREAVQCSSDQPADVGKGVITQQELAHLITTVDNNIISSSLKEMKFLCYNLVGTANILKRRDTDASQILNEMIDFGTLSKENPVLISELLVRLRRIRLEGELFGCEGRISWKDDEMETSFDNFRCLLFDITQHLKKEHLVKMKTFCIDQEELSQGDAKELTDCLDFFEFLEESDLIDYNNIGFLRDLAEILKRKAITDLIDNYEAKLKKTEPVLSLQLKHHGMMLHSSQIHSVDDIVTALERFPNEHYKKLIGSIRRKRRGQFQRGLTKYTAPQQNLLTPDMLSSEMGMVAQGNCMSSKLKTATKTLPDPVDKAAPLTVHLPKEDPDLDSDSVPKPLTGQVSDNSADASSYSQYQRRIPIYKMAKPKGICLIISNRKFGSGMKDRDGTERDAEKLSKTFVMLGFEVHIAEDLTLEKMEIELRKWRDFDHSKHHAFVCCILTHGNTGTVFGTDGKELQLVKVMGYFKSNCESLVGKPKIFIIQACQGNRWQQSSIPPSSPTGERAGMGSGLDIVPQESDFALILSTVPGFMSARSPKQGTWFIMSLTNILQRYMDAELHSVMTLVNDQLSTGRTTVDSQLICQLAYPVYTLRKLFFFCNPPGILD